METKKLESFKLVLNCIKVVSEFDGTDANHLPDFTEQIESLLPSVNAFDCNKHNILFGF